MSTQKILRLVNTTIDALVKNKNENSRWRIPANRIVLVFVHTETRSKICSLVRGFTKSVESWSEIHPLSTVEISFRTRILVLRSLFDVS